MLSFQARHWWALTSLCPYQSLATVLESVESPTVTLNYSSYFGNSLSNGVDEFVGMRYAAAPLGYLRFRGPMSPDIEDCPQRATKFRDFCLGTGEVAEPGVSEDCLFVNVWKPASATADSKLPVWVFIQGGGYNMNYSPNYNGSEVVETSGHNIVHVNFNYRVGLYGFFAGRNVEDYGDLNAGLRDQIALLQWVRDNIHQFGGDPDHVVIHGSSAGAGSVALHQLSPHSRTLFSGCILESTFMPHQPPKDELEWQYDRLAGQLQCESYDSETEMECIRSKSTEELQAVNVPSAFPGRPSDGAPYWYWVPCIDGDIIPDVPLDMFDRGEYADVPLIIGNNQNEGVYFAPNATSADEMVQYMANSYPRLSTDQLARISEDYPLMKPMANHAAWFPSAEAAYGDSTFVCPALSILEAIRRKRDSQKVWSYHINIQDDEYIANGLGCPHGYEEGAIFGPDNTMGRFQPPASFYTYNAPLVPTIMSYWISFVRSLSPNVYKVSEAPEWQIWDESRLKLLLRLGEMRMISTTEDQLGRCESWREIDRSLL